MALNLIEYGPTDTEELVVAILHDSVEDEYVPRELLVRLFGSSIADSINALSKIVPVFKGSGIVEKKNKSSAEYYGGILKSTNKIKRVKCADRLDNLRDMGAWLSQKDRMRRKLDETYEYIIPIAETLDGDFLPLIKAECNKLEKLLKKS